MQIIPVYWLIFYPLTSLNSLIDCNNFLIISLGFSMYSIMLSVSSKSFTTSFPIWILLFLFLLWLLWQVLLELCWIIVAIVGTIVLFELGTFFTNCVFFNVFHIYMNTDVDKINQIELDYFFHGNFKCLITSFVFS